MPAYLYGGTTRNLLVATQKQNTFYQRLGKQGNAVGYNQIPTALLGQTILSSENPTRNIKFEIPTPYGMTPGPAGLAGSPTVGTLSQPPNVSGITTAGVTNANS